MYAIHMWMIGSCNFCKVTREIQNADMELNKVSAEIRQEYMAWCKFIASLLEHKNDIELFNVTKKQDTCTTLCKTHVSKVRLHATDIPKITPNKFGLNYASSFESKIWEWQNKICECSCVGICDLSKQFLTK